jgi:hypothetical protein
MDPELKKIPHDDLLYDELGLPRSGGAATGRVGSMRR